MNYITRFLILLVLACLLTLTSCETTRVLVYPVIITPDLPEAPTRDPFVNDGFKAIDENNQLISNEDAQIIGNYIINLKEYGEILKSWLNYYKTSVNQFNEELEQ